MGDGIKIAVEDRPDLALISKRLDDRVSRKIQNIFVQDIQNDCSCSTETYDSDHGRKVLYVTIDGIKSSYVGRIPLPMMSL